VYLVNLILKKISKIGAIRCQILRLKCTKSDFGWGSAPADRARGAYSAPTDHLAVFKGPTSKGKEGRGREEGKRREGKGDVRGRGREERGERPDTPCRKFLAVATLLSLCCTQLFISRASDEIQSLFSLHVGTSDDFNDVVQYFGENPRDTTSDRRTCDTTRPSENPRDTTSADWFSDIAVFVNKFEVGPTPLHVC